VTTTSQEDANLNGRGITELADPTDTFQREDYAADLNDEQVELGEYRTKAKATSQVGSGHPLLPSVSAVERLCNRVESIQPKDECKRSELKIGLMLKC